MQGRIAIERRATSTLPTHMLFCARTNTGKTSVFETIPLDPDKTTAMAHHKSNSTTSYR